MSDAHPTRTHAEQFHEDGYAIIRGLFDPQEMAEIQEAARAIYAEGLTHPSSYRHKNLYFDVIDDPDGGHVVLQAHWFAWINETLDRYRRDPKVFGVLQPLLGDDIKQIANQIHWKPPGARLTGFRFHQDLRFRDKNALGGDPFGNSVTLGLAIDRTTAENGALQVFPGSHKLGYLGLSDDGGVLMKGTTAEEELRRVGLDPDSVVTCELEPGDAVMWSLLTVHGSGANRSSYDRAFNINSYVRASASERGELTFENGQPVPLGEEPVLCKYEDLYTNPGPFHESGDWYLDNSEEARAG